MMNRQLAFGIAASELSWAAFAWSCANLIRSGDNVVFIHIVENKSSCFADVQEIMARCEKQCLRFKVNFETIILNGNACSEIMKIITGKSVDLLVVGSKPGGRFTSELTFKMSKAICDFPVLCIPQMVCNLHL